MFSAHVKEILEDFQEAGKMLRLACPGFKGQVQVDIGPDERQNPIVTLHVNDTTGEKAAKNR